MKLNSKYTEAHLINGNIVWNCLDRHNDRDGPGWRMETGEVVVFLLDFDEGKRMARAYPGTYDEIQADAFILSVEID